MLRISSDSAEQTLSMAEKIGRILLPDSLLVLSGDLGAGKTVFAKGLALGLGIKERITSPTFMLAQEYESGRLPFCHLDVYRLENASYEDLGLEEYWQRGGVCLIEWGELIKEILPAKYTQITIISTGETQREILIEGEYEKLIDEALRG